MRIRQLDPGSAWSETELRAIPFGIVGFFLTGLASNFGYIPGIEEAFLVGICGAVGLFLAVIAVLIGFYHRKLALATIAALLIAVFPTIMTAVLLPWTGTGRTAFAPVIVEGMFLYFLLHRVHRKLSRLAFDSYVTQLGEGEHGDPKHGWQRKLYWLFVGLGALIVFALLTRG